MTELRPLLDTSDDELELALLHSADDDVPPVASMLGAAALIGLNGSVLGSVRTPTTSGTPSPTASGVHAAPHAALGTSSGVLARTSAALLALKPVALTIVAGLALLGGYRALELASEFAHSRSAPAHLSALAQRPSAPLQAPAPLVPSAPEPAAPSHTVAGESAPAETDRPRDSARAAVSGASAPSKRGPSKLSGALAHDPRAEVAPEPDPALALTTDQENEPEPARSPVETQTTLSLAPEVKLLDRARAALLAEDPYSALRVLDEYGNAKRSGILDPEAAVLRIRALLDLGQRKAAATLAQLLIASHPESRRVDWLRSLATEATLPR
jgi:hypothetical protein